MKATAQLASILLLCCIATSCGLRCAQKDCEPPPFAYVRFQFVNNQGENLLAIGQITEEDFNLTLHSTQESVNLSFYEDKAQIGFLYGEESYTLTVGTHSLEMEAVVEEVDNDECCNGFKLKSLFIDGVAVEPTQPENMVILVL